MTAHVPWFIPIAVPSNEVISMNGRAHWAAVHRQTVALRDRGFYAVRSGPHPRFSHAACRVLVGYPDTSRRRDAANYMGTVKPIIDGMVAARLLPDDDDTHLEGPFLTAWVRGDYPEVDDKCGRAFLSLPETVRWFRFVFWFDGQATW